MSKLGCKCGHVITDQTDSLPYKASLLRDEVENEFGDEVHRELKPLVEAAESGDKAAIGGIWRVRTLEQRYCRTARPDIQHLHSPNVDCLRMPELWTPLGAKGCQ